MTVEDGPVPRTMSGKVEYGALVRDGSDTITGAITGGRRCDGIGGVRVDLRVGCGAPGGDVRVARWRLAQLHRMFHPSRGHAGPTSHRLASDARRSARPPARRAAADAAGSDRHDRGAPSTRDLCGRGDPHASPVLAGRRAHAVGGCGVQPRPLHDADRVDPRSCACRVAHGGTRGRADDGVGGMLHLVLRGDVRHRHGAAGEQLRRPTKPPRRCLAFLVHRGLRPTDPRRHRPAGGAVHPPARAAVPVRVPAGTVRLHAVVAHGVGVDGRLVQHPLPHAQHRVLLRAGLADPALRLDAQTAVHERPVRGRRSPTSSTTRRGSGSSVSAWSPWCGSGRSRSRARSFARWPSLASASLWILISHFTIWPLTMDVMPLGWAYVATLACRGAGVGRRRPRDRHDLCTGPDRPRESPRPSATVADDTPPTHRHSTGQNTRPRTPSMATA